MLGGFSLRIILKAQIPELKYTAGPARQAREVVFSGVFVFVCLLDLPKRAQVELQRRSEGTASLIRDRPTPPTMKKPKQSRHDSPDGIGQTLCGKVQNPSHCLKLTSCFLSTRHQQFRSPQTRCRPAGSPPPSLEPQNTLPFAQCSTPFHHPVLVWFGLIHRKWTPDTGLEHQKPTYPYRVSFSS
ncbi:uncharacterized protein CLUP02_05633 [Colletotrichum lupini]|uniref:Uncharacterized protein n=1 Tax=Colletotrichum lupini TaxID=145971 RepID=A0A9Q8WED8_9PEZI|nr:uncharacterized protein CLUP02_05633 [Colletotrichum lupini]UQC80151.1 hypothetical protein CLUP02_05633 [Colletotrichum lupini]